MLTNGFNSTTDISAYFRYLCLLQCATNHRLVPSSSPVWPRLSGTGTTDSFGAAYSDWKRRNRGKFDFGQRRGLAVNRSAGVKSCAIRRAFDSGGRSRNRPGSVLTMNQQVEFLCYKVVLVAERFPWVQAETGQRHRMRVDGVERWLSHWKPANVFSTWGRSSYSSSPYGAAADRQRNPGESGHKPKNNPFRKLHDPRNRMLSINRGQGSESYAAYVKARRRASRHACVNCRDRLASGAIPSNA